MVLTRRQAQILINQSNELSTNQQFQMAAPVVNYVISPFEGNINTEDPQELKPYLQSTKEIDKDDEKLYI